MKMLGLLNKIVGELDESYDGIGRHSWRHALLGRHTPRLRVGGGKYMPHQGEREKTRRRRQMAKEGKR